MATSLSVPTILARIAWTFTNSTTAGDTTTSNSYSYSKALTNGTGASNGDRIYAVSTTLAAGATLNVDLAATLTDVFGSTITFARVKAIYFELTADTTASAVTLGGHGSAAFVNWVGDATDKVKVRNGGCFFLACTDATGYAVTATTGDMFTIINLDGSNVATYKLAIVGASA